jgi:hypothetical protein
MYTHFTSLYSVKRFSSAACGFGLQTLVRIALQPICQSGNRLRTLFRKLKKQNRLGRENLQNVPRILEPDRQFGRKILAGV